MDESHGITVPSFKTKSEIWTYFGFIADSDGVISDKKKIACRICRTVIAYSGNTSNMTYHLQRQHSSEYDKYLKRSGKAKNNDNSFSDSPGTSEVVSEQAGEGTSEPKQITLSAAFKRAAPLPSNSPRYSSLLRATMILFFKLCNR